MFLSQLADSEGGELALSQRIGQVGRLDRRVTGTGRAADGLALLGARVCDDLLLLDVFPRLVESSGRDLDRDHGSFLRSAGATGSRESRR